jgi:hypothetical protein
LQRLDRSTLLRIDHIESLKPHGVGAQVYLNKFREPVELGRTAYERLREILDSSSS